MTAEMAAEADLRIQALALVDAFNDARREDRDYLIQQCDVGDLMTGLVLVVTQLTCMLANAWGMPPGVLTGTLRDTYAEQATA